MDRNMNKELSRQRLMAIVFGIIVFIVIVIQIFENGISI
jgi:hypothetical protein